MLEPEAAGSICFLEKWPYVPPLANQGLLSFAQAYTENSSQSSCSNGNCQHAEK